MENIKFESALDVAVVLKDRVNIIKFLAEFFDNCNIVYEESDGCYVSIVRNEKTNYYNIDFDLLVYSFLMFVERLNLDRNVISNARFLFDKMNEAGFKKSTMFLLNVLTFHNVTTQPKGAFFYMSFLGKKINSQTHFQFNSVGINRMAILEFLGFEFEEKFIVPIAGNNKTIEVSGLGPKGVNTYKSNWGVKDEDIFKLSKFLKGR